MSQENLSSGVPNRSNKNQAVQLQETARSLKFRFLEAKEMVQSVDQLFGHCTADLHLCFCILCKNQVFS